MIKRSFSTAAAIVAAVLLFTTTAFAAWYFLKPGEVANKLGNSALSAAFDSGSAININESVISGDFTFTLLAIVSGKDISDQPYFNNNELRSDRSYIVTAVRRADGSPMQEDGIAQFYISPYVKGQKPWLVNAHTLGGGVSEIFADGVIYRLVEFENITMFADRGVYIGIIDGRFPNNQAFLINEQTGDLSVNPDYDGISVLFNLPIDSSLADPEKAQAFLDDLLGDIIIEDEGLNIGGVDSWSVMTEDAAAGAWTFIVGEDLVSQ